MKQTTHIQNIKKLEKYLIKLSKKTNKNYVRKVKTMVE